MQYRTVIFDLDGTLLDTRSGVFGSFAKTEREMHLTPLPEEKRRELIGPSLYDSFVSKYGLDEERAWKAVDCYRKYYKAGGVTDCTPYEGIEELLLALKKKGVRLCVATSKVDASARIALESKGLMRYFDCICAPDEKHTDSDKASLIARAMQAGEPPYLMAGDRIYDIEGARANGIDSIYLLSGFGSREEALLCKPEYVAENVGELSKLLLNPGVFISFEGMDGTGKTTQIRLVKEHLEERGYLVRVTREPGGTETAEAIRRVLLDPALTVDPITEAYLYAAARAEHVRGVIRPALLRGEIVLCDRYLDSSVAYQGFGRGLGEDTVRRLNEYALAGCMPDRTYLFFMDDRMADTRTADRRPRDRIEMAGGAFRAKVREGYERIALQDPDRIRTICADGSVEEVFDRVRRDLDAYLAAR